MANKFLGIIKQPKSNFGSESSVGILAFLGGIIVAGIALMVYHKPLKKLPSIDWTRHYGKTLPMISLPPPSGPIEHADKTIIGIGPDTERHYGSTTIPQRHSHVQELDWDPKWYQLEKNRFHKVATDDEGGTILQTFVQKAGDSYIWSIEPEYPGDERLPKQFREPIHGRSNTLAGAKREVESRI